ncbi:hypothetical protein [Sphaerisporangium dianthi]|uniref:Uncharacterized protein n=1 Tax=Sphaerisporangium dianthi TaxID=1436120 RepID=A0ABV9C8A5_9ACTN
MIERLVGVHLFRLKNVFNLSRADAAPRAATAEVAAPAILVIPREGPLREPHLMLFNGTRSFCAMPPGTLVSQGVHVVVHLDDGLREAWPEVADVVVGAAGRSHPFAAYRVTRVLSRYPGCEVATGVRRGGCLAGLRDGQLVKIVEAGGPMAATGPGPAVYGSFLYGWLAAGMPLGCLSTASVVHGRYAGPARGRPGALEVAGRAEIKLAGPVLRSVRRRTS